MIVVIWDLRIYVSYIEVVDCNSADAVTRGSDFQLEEPEKNPPGSGLQAVFRLKNYQI
ncbi:MAG: hypothetical protein VX906_06020 [Candidatus Thermoplasmatota archaeon]|nr:hypothetical protein [Candidatus Thermoplasmatota archaeon]